MIMVLSPGGFPDPWAPWNYQWIHDRLRQQLRIRTWGWSYAQGEVRNYIKRTVIVISSDPPCKDGNAQLHKYHVKFCPFKWSNQISIIILKTCYFQLWLLYKSDLRISIAGEHIGQIKEFKTFNLGKRQQYFPHY